METKSKTARQILEQAKAKVATEVAALEQEKPDIPEEPIQEDESILDCAEYTTQELRWWISLLTKRAEGRTDSQKDSDEANYYQAILDNRFEGGL